MGFLVKTYKTIRFQYQEENEYQYFRYYDHHHQFGPGNISDKELNDKLIPDISRQLRTCDPRLSSPKSILERDDTLVVNEILNNFEYLCGFESEGPRNSITNNLKDIFKRLYFMGGKANSDFREEIADYAYYINYVVFEKNYIFIDYEPLEIFTKIVQELGKSVFYDVPINKIDNLFAKFCRNYDSADLVIELAKLALRDRNPNVASNRPRMADTLAKCSDLNRTQISNLLKAINDAFNHKSDYFVRFPYQRNKTQDFTIVCRLLHHITGANMTFDAFSNNMRIYYQPSRNTIYRDLKFRTEANGFYKENKDIIQRILEEK